MNFALLSLVFALAPSVLADVQFVQPAAGASFGAGEAIPISWTDSGKAPALSSLTNYVIQICAGGNTAATYTCLAPLVTSGTFSTGNTAAKVAPISPTLGAVSTNGYFLMMVSTGTAGSVTNFSPRFGMTGMTGVFLADTLSGITSVGTSTSGPPTINANTGVVAPNPVDPVVPDINPSTVAAGSFEVPYTMQTGSIRYAPMQPQPGTKITASVPSMLNPTSSVVKASIALAPPSIQTTVTQVRPVTVTSIENTASAAPFTAEAMQKWLNRWKD